MNHFGKRDFTCTLLNVAGFIRISLGSLLIVAVFTRVHVGSLGRDKEFEGSFGFAWVHLTAPIYMLPSLYWFVWVHSSTSSGRRCHSGSRGFTRARIAVIGFRVGHSGV